MRYVIWVGGPASLAAFIALAVSQAPLGSPLFFALAAVPCVVYGLLLPRLLGRYPLPSGTGRALAAALLFAVAFRVPLALPRVGHDNDMVRYQWDGRLQRAGLNPYLSTPVDPSVAWLHTDDTRAMPSRRDRTPYPAAAQWFFRLVVTIHDSARAMKIALVLCDLLTIGVLLKWLPAAGCSPWLVLVYAWNPLVILEVAHSGHIDALGALWLAVAAWMLTTGRGLRASLAFTLAVATKLLPIVLLPLLWKRIRLRDAAAGAVLFGLLYLPFASAGTLPLGSVPNVVAVVRFNGPAFKWLALGTSPPVAAAIAIAAGFAVAVWMRRRTRVCAPAAWAYPMAASLALAPVVYPWYLLYLTPFLFRPAMLPLVAWTFSILPVYAVWELSRHGHRWVVPAAVMIVEYGAVIAALTIVSLRRRSRSRSQ